jgi:hypothetical protein
VGAIRRGRRRRGPRIGDAVRGFFRSDDRGPGKNGGGNETNASDETTTAGNETASGDAAVAPYRR